MAEPQSSKEEFQFTILIRRFFGLVTLSFGALVIWFTWPDFHAWLSPTEETRLQAIWNEDMARLLSENLLPKAWSSIAEIETIPASEEAKRWLQTVHPMVPRVENGRYKLEILIDSWADEEIKKSGAMVQYNLVERATGNTVWERGRTFILKDHSNSP